MSCEYELQQGEDRKILLMYKIQTCVSRQNSRDRLNILQSPTSPTGKCATLQPHRPALTNESKTKNNRERLAIQIRFLINLFC